MAFERAALLNPVKFGDDFELDPRAYELRRGGRRLKLERIPMELLLLLIEQRGQLVTRNEITELIWGKDVFLDANTSINSAVRKIRLVLKDDPEEPRFLQTVTGRGYRFVGPIETVAPPPQNIPARTGLVLDAPSRNRRPWIVGLVAVGLLLIVGVGVRARHPSPTISASAPIRTIAVLPLENLTGDPAQQYFTDGMTDALITALAQIQSLRVISRTSTMHYSDSKKTLPEIARELGADAVVEGAVMRSGNRVRIDAQLIQVPADRHLWARSYERDVQDVLTLESELARTIASEVQIELTAKELDRLGKAPAVRPDAYEAYLKGRFFWNKRSKEAIGQSVDYFNEAIRLDPTYAAAYSGLADAYNISGCGRPAGMTMADAGPKARTAALKAVELDPNSAEAHAALGFEKFCYEGDRLGAENEYRRAIALNPNYATAHHWYARLLLGWRDQDALDQIQSALRLDPVSPNINGMLGDYLLETRQFEKAVEQLRKTVDLEPEQFNSRIRLGFAYAHLHRYAQAENEFKEAEKISPDSVMSLAALAYVYALQGRRSETERLLPNVKSRAVKAGHPMMVCLVYIGLGNKDEAIVWLEKAYQQRDSYLNYYFNLKDPLLDPLRSDRRFEDLERGVRAVPHEPGSLKRAYSTPR